MPPSMDCTIGSEGNGRSLKTRSKNVSLKNTIPLQIKELFPRNLAQNQSIWRPSVLGKQEDLRSFC